MLSDTPGTFNTMLCMNDVRRCQKQLLKLDAIKLDDNKIKWTILRSHLSWYLGSDGCRGDVGGGAVLGGCHPAVLLLLILLLALHTFVFCLAAWRTVGRRRKGWRWRRQVLQFVYHLFYFHHRVPKEVDGVRQRWEDELKAFLGQIDIKQTCL